MGDRLPDGVPDDGNVGLPVEVDDTDAVRRHFGFRQIDLFGWSYVGLVVALHAARYPRHVRRLVMACPTPLREEPSPPPTDVDRKALDRLTELRASGLERDDPVAFARACRRITAPTRIGATLRRTNFQAMWR